MSKTVKALLTACALAATAGATLAQEQVVNLYSARHYSPTRRSHGDHQGHGYQDPTAWTPTMQASSLD